MNDFNMGNFNMNDLGMSPDAFTDVTSLSGKALGEFTKLGGTLAPIGLLLICGIFMVSKKTLMMQALGMILIMTAVVMALLMFRKGLV